MKTLLVLLTVFGSLSAQAASYRRIYYSHQFTCEYMQGEVQKYGKAVIYQTPYIYDRYSRFNCHSKGSMGKSGYVKSSDVPRCFVGYKCG